MTSAVFYVLFPISLKRFTPHRCCLDCKSVGITDVVTGNEGKRAGDFWDVCPAQRGHPDGFVSYQQSHERYD